MNLNRRVIAVLVSAVVPLILSACFSSNPTRQGEQSNRDSQGSGSQRTGNPSDTGSGSSTGNDTGSSSQSGGSRGSTPQAGSPGQPGGLPSSQPGFEIPTMDDQSGQRGQSDIRVATANSTGSEAQRAAEAAAEAAENAGTEGSSDMDGQADVSVAEALEGANAAVDAAAGAVAEAEATIARAREELETDAESGGSGEVDNFDPWAKAGSESASESDSNDSDNPAEQQQDNDDGAGRPQIAQNDETEDDSFDPFSTYGEENEESNRIPRSNSLETADDAVVAAKAALNRARRSLIKAATSGDDTDAEAVQLNAARAAMEAAAEAVIASAIAVMAASDAFADDEEYDAEAAEDAQEQMARGIEMVVDITRRDMTNAAEALEATGELLAAAGSLMGMLGGVEDAEDQNDEFENNEQRVASLEKELDRSLSVFDGRMEEENRGSAGAIISDDSETASLTMGQGAEGGNATDGKSTVMQGGDSDSVGIDKTLNRVEARYEQPERMGRGEDFEQYQIEEGRAQDDDIVARQLREAAMAETDPELREALWREYKNYKESLESGEAEASQ